MIVWLSRYRLDQVRARWCKLEEAKEKENRCWTWSRRLDWIIQAPRPWSRRLSLLQSTHISSRNSRIQILKNSSDLIVIQATGLIRQNQAETPWWFLMRIQAPRPNLGDWICAISVFQKTHLCFKLLLTPRPIRHEMFRAWSAN